jgi:hypothetical protein
MFSFSVRFIIVLVAASNGGYSLANGHRSGYLWLAAAALIAIGYFRYGPIRPAFLAMQRGRLDVAQKHIETIPFPKLLSAQSHAYLHWIRGVIAAQDTSSLLYAEEQMRLALGGAIRTSHDRCLATATLAQIVAQTHDLKRAQQILAEAEKIPHRDIASDYLNKLKAEFGKAT